MWSEELWVRVGRHITGEVNGDLVSDQSILCWLIMKINCSI